jgi:hypothetical protein
MPRCENPECGKEVHTVRRVVIAGDYDASLKKAVFLCPECSDRKLRELTERGYQVDQEIFKRISSK